VVFYRTEAGTEPVREWLKRLTREDRRAVGQDVKKAQKTPLADLKTARQRLANLRKPLSKTKLSGDIPKRHKEP